MTDKVKEYLLQTIDSSINSLNADKTDVEKIDSNKATYKVSIWSHKYEQSIDKKFSGSLPKVIKAAESEFKKNNNIKKAWADTYSVYICVGDKEHNLPNEVWQQYRTL